VGGGAAGAKPGPQEGRGQGGGERLLPHCFSSSEFGRHGDMSRPPSLARILVT
jgi:hypothetical protein